jgi:NAD(P)-dependent dehydrogenase (short-subunit alcohol dehydrogenase family)
VPVAALDLSDQESIGAFVAAWRGPLHILVCNAGIMATGAAHCGGLGDAVCDQPPSHFTLALGLHDALKQANHARVVVVSSVGHVNGDVQFDDLNFDHHPYDPWKAYAQSKTANILFTVEAARRWKGDGITVNALNPGRIGTTRLGRFMAAPPASFDPNSKDVSYKTIEQGAATSVLLAGSPLVEGVTGTYFEDCQPAVPYKPGVRRGVASYALDPEHAARLWQISLQLIRQGTRGDPLHSERGAS